MPYALTFGPTTKDDRRIIRKYLEQPLDKSEGYILVFSTVEECQLMGGLLDMLNLNYKIKKCRTK